MVVKMSARSLAIANLCKQWIFELYGLKSTKLAIDEGIITESEVYDLIDEAEEVIDKHIEKGKFHLEYYLDPYGEKERYKNDRT